MVNITNIFSNKALELYAEASKIAACVPFNHINLIALSVLSGLAVSIQMANKAEKLTASKKIASLCFSLLITASGFTLKKLVNSNQVSLVAILVTAVASTVVRSLINSLHETRKLLENQNTRLKEHEEQIPPLKDDLANLKAQQLSDKSHLEIIKEENTSLREHNQKLIQLQKTKEGLIQLQLTTINTQNKKLRECNEEITQLKNSLTNLEAQQLANKSHLETFTRENTNLRERNKEITQLNNDQKETSEFNQHELNKRVTILKEENALLKSRLENLMKLLEISKVHEAEKNQLREDNDRLKVAIEESSRELGLKREQSKKRKSYIKEQATKLTNLTARSENRLKEQKKGYQSTIDHLRTENQELKDRNSQLQRLGSRKNNSKN